MKLIIILGPPAVGKMTIGQELEKLSGIPLLHNHMSLELVNRFFDFSTPSFDRLDRAIRFAIFKEIAASSLPGVIFTFFLALNGPSDQEYVDDIIQTFDKGTELFYIELLADQKIRMERNTSENRLLHTPSKRNILVSKNSLLNADRDYRMNTLPGEFSDKTHLKIDTTHLDLSLVAQKIFKFITTEP